MQLRLGMTPLFILLSSKESVGIVFRNSVFFPEKQGRYFCSKKASLPWRCRWQSLCFLNLDPTLLGLSFRRFFYKCALKLALVVEKSLFANRWYGCWRLFAYFFTNSAFVSYLLCALGYWRYAGVATRPCQRWSSGQFVYAFAMPQSLAVIIVLHSDGKVPLQLESSRICVAFRREWAKSSLLYCAGIVVIYIWPVKVKRQPAKTSAIGN